MKYILLASLLTIFLIFNSCEHEISEPKKKIQISGISGFDNMGFPTTAPDPEDWTYDSIWTPEETKLLLYDGMTEFKKPSSASDTNKIVVQPIFPNPVKSSCTFSLEHSKAAKLKIVLVDAFLEKLTSTEFHLNGSASFSFQIDLSALKKGELYRFYYVFLNNKSELYYRGHGDILKD